MPAAVTRCEAWERKVRSHLQMRLRSVFVHIFMSSCKTSAGIPEAFRSQRKLMNGANGENGRTCTKFRVLRNFFDVTRRKWPTGNQCPLARLIAQILIHVTGKGSGSLFPAKSKMHRVRLKLIVGINRVFLLFGVMWIFYLGIRESSFEMKENWKISFVSLTQACASNLRCVLHTNIDT